MALKVKIQSGTQAIAAIASVLIVGTPSMGQSMPGVRALLFCDQQKPENVIEPAGHVAFDVTRNQCVTSLGNGVCRSPAGKPPPFEANDSYLT
jgi:hypothetical protein